MNANLPWRNLSLMFITLYLLGGLAERALSGMAPPSLLIFSVIPVLLLYALLTERIRLMQWLGFALMFQFIASVLRAFLPGNTSLRIVIVLCCVLAFISVVFTINQLRKQQRASNPESDQ